MLICILNICFLVYQLEKFSCEIYRILLHKTLYHLFIIYISVLFYPIYLSCGFVRQDHTTEPKHSSNLRSSCFRWYTDIVLLANIIIYSINTNQICIDICICIQCLIYHLYAKLWFWDCSQTISLQENSLSLEFENVQSIYVVVDYIIYLYHIHI